MDALFLQATLFTAGAALLIGGSTWFLYFSPLKKTLPAVFSPSRPITNLLVAVLGLAGLLMIIGGLWDASMHIQTGEVPGGSDFLWPPHLVLYGGFLLSFLSGLTALAVAARQGWRKGARDPRRWFRQNLQIGAVALAAGYTLLSIPGDAIWHELFGVDLTAWSPPHILIALMSVTLMASAAGLFIKVNPRSNGGVIRNLVITYLFSIMLNLLYTIGVLEWELPRALPPEITSRPLWLYPVLGGLIAFICLLLAKKATGWRWAATVTALLFYLVRLGVTGGLLLSGSLAPLLPLWFILGALLMDLSRWNPPVITRWPEVSTALVFFAGYLLLAALSVAANPVLTGISLGDFLISAIGSLAVSLLALPLVRLLSRRLGS